MIEKQTEYEWKVRVILTQIIHKIESSIFIEEFTCLVNHNIQPCANRLHCYYIISNSCCEMWFFKLPWSTILEYRFVFKSCTFNFWRMRSALIVSVHFKCGASCIMCLERIRIRKTPLELSFFLQWHSGIMWKYIKD